jgi:DNA-binding NarL/FixJ family response regulator
MSVSLLLADDHHLVRAGLRQLLSEMTGFTVVAEATTGPEVLSRVAELLASPAPKLDLVLLDIGLPERDGLDVLQELKREHPSLPVLMLSTYPEEQYAVRCLKLGAAGYLHKTADPDALAAAITKAAAGGVVMSERVAQLLATSVGAQRGSLPRTGVDALSHREHQVYRLLVQGKSVTEIGVHLRLAANTVSTYRARILEKTGAKNDVELALLTSNNPRP